MDKPVPFDSVLNKGRIIPPAKVTRKIYKVCCKTRLPPSWFERILDEKAHIMPELKTDFESLPEEYQHIIRLVQEATDPRRRAIGH